MNLTAMCVCSLVYAVGVSMSTVLGTFAASSCLVSIFSCLASPRLIAVLPRLDEQTGCLAFHRLTEALSCLGLEK